MFPWKNHAKNVHQELVLNCFLILVNDPKQPLHARNSFKNRCFERGLSKSIEKVHFIIPFEPSPF